MTDHRDLLGGRLSWTGNRLRLDTHTLIAGLVCSYVVGIVLVLLAPWLPPIVAVPPIVVVLTFVPGLLTLISVADIDVVGAKELALALGVSLGQLMLVGLVINLALPAVGIERPLSVPWLVISISLLVGSLATLAYVNRKDSTCEIAVHSPLAPAPLAFALLPLASVLGVVLLNRTDSNLLLLAVLVVIAFVPCATYLWVSEKWHSFGIWALAMAVVYHDVVAEEKSFPGNPVVVRTWRAARWEPGTTDGGRLATELLQHGTIFPSYARLTDINIMAELLLINPFFVSFIPVILFVAFRHYIGSKRAFIGASIFVFAHPFYNQYPTAGRAATPVLFLALFALVLSDSTYDSYIRSRLALLYLSGIAVTHYGTSYFTLAAMSGALVALFGFNLLDQIVDQIENGPGFDRLNSRVEKRLDRLSNIVTAPAQNRRKIFTLSLVALFAVMVFSWFLYTNNSRAFELFPRHFARIAEQVFTSQTEGGRTGARLERNYGSFAVSTSKKIYLILGLTMIVGLVAAVIRRFYRHSGSLLDDPFIGMGGAMFGLFGMTIAVRTWGGGRPMMITFVFTLLFAVVGVAALGEQLERYTRKFLSETPVPPIEASHVLTGFTLFLSVLFIMNSGVAVATGISTPPSPSGTPTQFGESYTHIDASTHAWLVDHHHNGSIYGDDTAFGQTDWLAPAISVRTEGGEEYGGARPRNELEPLMKPEAPSGYLILLRHNVASGMLARYSSSQPLSVIDQRYRQNVIYTTGNSRVHYFNATSA